MQSHPPAPKRFFFQRVLPPTLGLLLGLSVVGLLAVPLSFLPSPLGGLLLCLVAAVTIFLGILVSTNRLSDILAVFTRRREPTHSQIWISIPADSFPVMLDLSAILDGRIVDIGMTWLVSGTRLIPQFVVDELQVNANSKNVDVCRRGQRGLDLLQELRKQGYLIVNVVETDAEIRNANDSNSKLLRFARKYHARLLTASNDLTELARLQGILVMNINELAKAVKAQILPGDLEVGENSVLIWPFR